MKKFIITCGLLTSLSSFGFTIEDIAGSYKVSQPVFEVSNLLTIGEQGEINLTESSPMGTLTCSGQATINEDIVSSQLNCENGTSYTQTIDLNEVESVKAVFTAPIFSSLFDREIPFVFEPLKDNERVYSFENLAGKYEVSHPMMGVVNFVTIMPDGRVELIESSGMGNLKCEGQATLTDNIIESELLCANQLTFTQKIDLSAVTNITDEFAASVFTSLLGEEVILTFKRVE